MLYVGTRQRMHKPFENQTAWLNCTTLPPGSLLLSICPALSLLHMVYDSWHALDTKFYAFKLMHDLVVSGCGRTTMLMLKVQKQGATRI